MMRAIIKKALDDLAEKKNGKLTVSTVIEAARNPGSPLHDCFTWDMKEGFRKNLESEARHLLNTYYEVIYTPSGKALKTRHFVSLTTDRKDGNGYRVMSDVLSDEDLYRQLLEDAMREFQSFERKYASIRELKPLFKVARKIKQQTKPVGVTP